MSLIKKQWILLCASCLITLALALSILRLLAPQLLGIPVDLQMVQSGETVPAFFDGVFREDDYRQGVAIIRDPYLHVRAKPLNIDTGLWGPTDLLGFRNRSVPAVADVIVIGDSQTFGNNAYIENNFPGQLAARLQDKRPVLYNMSAGGWGAIEYFEIFQKALKFRPRVIVVAFYTGNDPLDSYLRAYASDRWARLRSQDLRHRIDPPRVNYPAPESQQWPVEFPDGVRTVFTPHLRYSGNRDHPASRAGYDVMANVARAVVEMAAGSEARVVFTILPSKELAFREKLASVGIEEHPVYRALVEAERRNLDWLARELRAIPNASYVDVVDPLQKAISESAHQHYPATRDGHPLPRGYGVIAGALLPEVDQYLPEPPQGLFYVEYVERRHSAPKLVLVAEGRKWDCLSDDMARANGWDVTSIPRLPARSIATIPWAMTPIQVDPTRFGPEAVVAGRTAQ